MTAKTPIRTCIACRQAAPKETLVRFVRAADGTVSLDGTGRQAGRGAYVCPQPSCFEAARRGSRLNRALRTELSEATWESLAQAFGDVSAGHIRSKTDA